MTTPSAAEARQAAKFQEDLARIFVYDDVYERSLQLRDRDPKEWSTLNPNHRSAVGYYAAMRDAAEASGRDITGGMAPTAGDAARAARNAFIESSNAAAAAADIAAGTT